MTVAEKIRQIGIVPVVKIEDIENAGPLAQALCDGGIPCVEVTFRTNAAKEAIREMKKACPKMLVGAGTVLTTQQVDEAIEVGAEFIVSPGLNTEIVTYCKKCNIPDFPGCSNASDLEQAISCGLSVVKFFPAEVSGGIKAIKALSAPYHNMQFMPTGGINENNLNEYLAEDNVLACGGTWMVPSDLINDRKFEEISKLADNAMRKMIGFQIAHVGINCNNETEARATADFFEKIFGFEKHENPGSIFSASFIESMKTPYLGKLGHIAIAVNSVERAKRYVEQKGIQFNESSTVYRKDGKIQTIYLKEEITEFAIHLVRKSD